MIKKKYDDDDDHDHDQEDNNDYDVCDDDNWDLSSFPCRLSFFFFPFLRFFCFVMIY